MFLATCVLSAAGKEIVCSRRCRGQSLLLSYNSRSLERAYLGVSTNSRASYTCSYSNEQPYSSSCSGRSTTSPSASDCDRLDKLKLTFSKNELTSYTDRRAVGLSRQTTNWLRKAAKILWNSTKGEIAKRIWMYCAYTCCANTSTCMLSGKSSTSQKHSSAIYPRRDSIRDTKRSNCSSNCQRCLKRASTSQTAS
jgi:hypothetical protein